MVCRCNDAQSDLTADQSHRVFLQRVNEQRVSKDGSAVFGHFGLLLGSDGRGDARQVTDPHSHVNNTLQRQHFICITYKHLKLICKL